MKESTSRPRKRASGSSKASKAPDITAIAAQAGKLFWRLYNVIGVFNEWYQPEMMELEKGITARYQKIPLTFRAGIRAVFRRSAALVKAINEHYDQIQALLPADVTKISWFNSEEFAEEWEKNLMLVDTKEGGLGWFGEKALWAMMVLRVRCAVLARMCDGVVEGKGAKVNLEYLVEPARELLDTALSSFPGQHLPDDERK